MENSLSSFQISRKDHLGSFEDPVGGSFEFVLYLNEDHLSMFQIPRWNGLSLFGLVFFYSASAIKNSRCASAIHVFNIDITLVSAIFFKFFVGQTLHVIPS